MNDEWNDYRVFLAVLRTGGFSSAAPALDLAPITVRRHIERLETALGAALFDQTAAALTPTAAAMALEPVARAMEEAAAHFAFTADLERDAVAGLVTICSSEALWSFALAEVLAELHAEHDRLQIRLRLSDDPVAEALDSSDITLHFARPDSPDAEITRVARLEFGLYASAGLLRRTGRPAAAAGLAGMPLIGALSTSRPTPLLDALMAQVGLSPRPSMFRFRSDSRVDRLSAVRAGAGVGVCATAYAARCPDLERLFPEAGAPLSLWLGVRASRASLTRVRVVRDVLAARMGEAFEGPGAEPAP